MIPVSIGGNDRFTVIASRAGNAQVNRALDEPFAQRPFVKNMRRVRGIEGRRRSLPVVRWPGKVGRAQGTIDMSRPLITFDTTRRGSPYALNVSRDLLGERFEFQLDFEVNQVLSYGCRLALGAAFFLFGETFRRYGYHHELRELMTSPRSTERLRFKATNVTGRGAFWALSWPRSAESLQPLWPALCKSTQGHLVFTEHHRSELVLAISLFGGFFQWYFNIAREPRRFPIGGEFELGAVVELTQAPAARFRRTDLRTYLEEFMLTLRRPL